jgi:succinate dehydrogenase/fumarate reductase-like Fe-S protein
MVSIYAKLVFVFMVFLHFLKFPFRWRRRGLKKFWENYRGDRLFPLTSEDRDWLFRFSKCINCGLCDSNCTALGKVPREKFPGPSYLLTTYTRATPDFWAADLDFALCQSCDNCRDICPNLVPVKEALEFIEAKTQIQNHGPYFLHPELFLN